MAGDHKCPVCQATFTRPQHVARHMRSHTGDRPYKCQHCGDQFARSDLLSRHVNKCHAGDKPPTTTAPTRRKGQHGASSTRATTSKQACDQCVIATLPCDGANPCSKCVQRKSPCTYVKFQRQTAPSGPGHKNSHSVDSTSSVSNLSSAMPRADDLFLGPPPMTVPSMVPAGELFYPNAHPQFAFNPPPGPHNWDSDSPNPPSLTLSNTTDSGPDGSSTDVAAHFRNSDPTLVPPGYPAPGTAESGLIPNSHAYYGQQHHPQPGATSVSWQMPADYHMQRKIEDGFAQYLPPGSSAQLGSPSSLAHPANLDYHNGGLYNLHARRGSIDGFSDGSGASAPNSAASSSVHLPLDFGAPDQEHQQQQQHLNDIMSYAQYGDGHPPPSRDGRFASSFGSLSINDAGAPFNYNNNVHGPEGNAPFFTQHAMKLPPQDSTPRPFRTDEDPSQLQSPRDREAEMRDLRDFWKQYLRTPLTGPSLGQTPKAELINNQLGALGEATRPTPKRGLSRVASLPSVRTPPDEKLSAAMARANNNHNIPTVQTTDDLKKYEEAVLARKPLNLTFIPRKGRLSVPSSVSPQPNPEQQMLQHQNLASQLFVEPGPLANFPHSNDNSGDDNPPMSAGGCRPSFKRLPSQTLENTVQKRALFRWGGEDPLDDTDSETDGPGALAHAAGAGGYHHPHNGVPMGAEHYRTMQFAHTESLLDRYRRQSMPTGVRPNLDPGGVPHEHSPSPVGYAGGAMHAGHMVGDVGMSSPPPPGQSGGALVQS
ncbi:hypothetical protein M0805_005244 [Coniferiporia weirii]|nr:hypothetical protein M0805_005244 [Coniferiporia weirii]